ncbi:MAG: Gfo/Idh/MocA family oxidoreductase [Pirellulaceae bacterium]
MQPADFVIQPDVRNFEITEFSRAKEMSSIGAKAALDALPQLKQLLSRIDNQLFKGSAEESKGQQPRAIGFSTTGRMIRSITRKCNHEEHHAVGLIGSNFISKIHARSLRQCHSAEILAVCSPTPGNAAEFAGQFDIPHSFTNHQQMLEMDEIDMVVIGAPNDVHCQLTCDAAAAGKHVVLEKPMCLNLSEADRMIQACQVAGVKLMYAEELCFAPKYVRLKQLLDSGAAR